MEVENWGKMHGFDHPFSLEGVVQKYVFRKVLLPYLTQRTRKPIWQTNRHSLPTVLTYPT